MVRLWSTAKGTARRPGRTFSFFPRRFPRTLGHFPQWSVMPLLPDHEAIELTVSPAKKPADGDRVAPPGRRDEPHAPYKPLSAAGQEQIILSFDVEEHYRIE